MGRGKRFEGLYRHLDGCCKKENVITNVILFIIGFWAIPFGFQLHAAAAVVLFFFLRSTVCFLVLSGLQLRKNKRGTFIKNAKQSYFFAILVWLASFLTVSISSLVFQDNFITANIFFTVGRIFIFPFSVERGND